MTAEEKLQVFKRDRYDPGPEIPEDLPAEEREVMLEIQKTSYPEPDIPEMSESDWGSWSHEKILEALRNAGVFYVEHHDLKRLVEAKQKKVSLEKGHARLHIRLHVWVTDYDLWVFRNL